MRVAAQGTADHPGGPLGVFLRMAAIPLAAALALMGQVVLSRPGGYSRSLLPGAVVLALALALLIFVLARRRFEDAEEPRGWKRTAPGLRDLPPGLEWTLIALLVFGGLYLRLYRIDLVPWGLNNDEAINALDRTRPADLSGTEAGRRTLLRGRAQIERPCKLCDDTGFCTECGGGGWRLTLGFRRRCESCLGHGVCKRCGVL